MEPGRRPRRDLPGSLGVRQGVGSLRLPAVPLMKHGGQPAADVPAFRSPARSCIEELPRRQHRHQRVYLAGSHNRVTGRAFVQDAAGRTSSGGRTSLAPGRWATVSVSVPSTAAMPLSRLGIGVTTKDGTYTGDAYLDDVRW